MSPGLRIGHTIPSKLRRNLPDRVSPRLARLMEEHAHNVHGLSFVRLYDTKSLLKHSEQADPSKVIPHPSRKGWVRINPQFYETNQIGQQGRVDTGNWRFLPISKKGPAVLYKVWGTSGIDQQYVNVHEPEKTNQFFVVDPNRKSIDYYNGNFSEPFMKQLFDKCEPVNLHDAFWEHFNKGRKTSPSAIVCSAEYDAQTGVPKHIRSQNIANSLIGRRAGAFIIHNESASPSNEGKARREPRIIHERARLRKVGPYDPYLGREV
ncbi:MAG TPA: hypothetical protein HA254_05970 [Candidatus Diapherotrites archaeon]|uniref:Uncharacterized protein n=1 Tax=Candidatus Iainarchaeum sp. TaxID=3101447 RepID=A0A7J4IX98_9ARCH|nr:hypothetical protein [Candidatus Diapherotrites archaeon]